MPRDDDQEDVAEQSGSIGDLAPTQQLIRRTPSRPTFPASGSSQAPSQAATAPSNSTVAAEPLAVRRQSLSRLDPDAFYLVLRCQTVIAALQANAASIPVYCDVFTPKVLNSHNTASPPTALAPTSLQSEIPHLAFVAALPFAGLRDKILRALGHIDYDELWRDAVSGGFFVWGDIAWMPNGWEVTEAFARKWWFLMDGEVVETANFWRIQRGLPRLSRVPESRVAGADDVMGG
jgi:hypothetical protein